MQLVLLLDFQVLGSLDVRRGRKSLEVRNWLMGRGTVWGSDSLILFLTSAVDLHRKRCQVLHVIAMLDMARHAFLGLPLLSIFKIA